MSWVRGGSASCGRMAGMLSAPRSRPPSAPARRGHGGPGPAAAGSPPDAAAHHDAPCHLCHSPRRKWRDPRTVPAAASPPAFLPAARARNTARPEPMAAPSS